MQVMLLEVLFSFVWKLLHSICYSTHFINENAALTQSIVFTLFGYFHLERSHPVHFFLNPHVQRLHSFLNMENCAFKND